MANGYGYNDAPDFSSPILGPLYKAIRIRQTIDDIGYEKERRRRERELFSQTLQDRQHQRLLNDLSTAITLKQLGAFPTLPGDNPKNDQLIRGAFDISPEGYREPVQVPMGGSERTYRLPSQKDLQQRGFEAEQAAARLKFFKSLASERGKIQGEMDSLEPLDLLPELGGGEVFVKPSQRLNAILDMHRLAHPDLDLRITSPNDRGDAFVVGLDKKTGQVVTKSLIEGAGKTKTQPQPKTTGLSSQAQFALSVAQKKIDEARAFDSEYARLSNLSPDALGVAGRIRSLLGFGANDKNKDLAERYRSMAQIKWGEAESTVNNAVKGHPIELEGGKGQGGYPYIQPRQLPTASTAPSATGTPGRATLEQAVRAYREWVSVLPNTPEGNAKREQGRREFIRQSGGVDPER